VYPFALYGVKSRTLLGHKAAYNPHAFAAVNRLKVLASIKGIGYQTLLRQFVADRVYEEEKREGILK
jgi:hypothetical protein